MQTLAIILLSLNIYLVGGWPDRRRSGKKVGGDKEMASYPIAMKNEDCGYN